MIKGHPFHLVEISPWPMVTAFSLLTLTSGIVIYFNGYQLGLETISLGLILVIISSFVWWRDVIRESTYQGYHTSLVESGLRQGFVVFIVSEVFFFVSWFWAFFHSALAPSVELGCVWPPVGLETLNPWCLPFLNTIILLSSGASSTWAHNALLLGNFKGYSNAILSLVITLFLGFIFTCFQGFEYFTAPFNISDGIYGATFYLATGFHGIHVLIGSVFLAVNLVRIIKGHLTTKHHLGFECALYYWHGVDLVWILLFISIYLWGY